jgi:hypothetical protein
MIVNHRKYNYSFAELIDRLCIVSSKLVYGNQDSREAFEQEISDIVHYIQLDIDEGVVVTGDIIRAIVVLTQSNLTLWFNEQAIRDYETEMDDHETASKLRFTHRLNGTRSNCKARIQNLIGGRIDPKINCLAEGTAWDIKW